MPITAQLSPNQLVALLPGADPELLAETLVAFANADGGTLYVGLNAEGQPTGEIYPEEINGLFHQAEAQCHPPIPVEWQQTEWSGEFVFVGRIRRSPELHTLRDEIGRAHV